jgi:hypothetical protein
MIMRPVMLVFVVAAGFTAGGAFYASTVQKGVKQERARVEIQAKKTHVKAEKARAAVASRPAPSVLDGQFRD